MASKIDKGTSTASVSSSRQGGGNASKKRGEWAKKCINWLSLSVPVSSVHPLNNPKVR